MSAVLPYENTIPPARPDSVDRLISDQLDRTNELLKAGRFRDALDHLAANLAIELGQQAADWSFLRPLADAQLRKHPDRAGGWLSKLFVSLQSSTPAEFQNDLRSVPELLEGTIRGTAQLANLELRYGQVERGMRRLYRMVRSNLDEPEALSAYLLSIVGAPSELPLMEDKLPTVTPGSCIALIDEFGQTTRLVPGVWPQALLMHCADRDLVTPAKRSFATVRQFLTNRSFVSLSPADLTWMVLQGGAYLQQGMQRFKVYLSADATDFATTVRVAFDFLTQIASHQTHFGAFGELFEHVIEAAMRHKRCPPNFDEYVADFIVKLTASANNSCHPYAPANAFSTKRMQIHRRLLAQRFGRARGRRKAPPDKRAIAVRAIFCSTIPSLVEEKSNPTAEAATEVPAQTAEQISAQTAATEEAPAKPVKVEVSH